MGKVFGIDLGTTYSCIAYIDENGKPVVLKNAEGDLTTPSAVFFETQTDVTVGSAAKESAKMYPEQVVTFIKRSIGQPGFSLNLNGIDMKPEEISSYILKKVVKDAEDSLRKSKFSCNTRAQFLIFSSVFPLHSGHLRINYTKEYVAFFRKVNLSKQKGRKKWK